MNARAAVCVAMLGAASTAAGGVYDPPPGSYSPEQDPKTVVRPGFGVGPVRFGDDLVSIRRETFGPTRGPVSIDPVPGRRAGWVGRRYGALRVLARHSARRPIVAFVLTGPGYRTRRGFGVGDSLSAARASFGKSRRVTVAGRATRIWAFRSAGSRVFVELGSGPVGAAKIARWAIVRDGRLPAVPTLHQVARSVP